jgi:hypothetical protein
MSPGMIPKRFQSKHSSLAGPVELLGKNPPDRVLTRSDDRHPSRIKIPPVFSLPLKNGTKRKIRNILCSLFSCLVG